jgi:hypothetical protein
MRKILDTQSADIIMQEEIPENYKNCDDKDEHKKTETKCDDNDKHKKTEIKCDNPSKTYDKKCGNNKMVIYGKYGPSHR